jgi:hypothetical protein
MSLVASIIVGAKGRQMPTRRRAAADFALDIRQLRFALDLTIEAASKVLGEHRTLIQSQEQGGNGVDREFVELCASRYLKYARECARRGAMPAMTSQSGTTMIYRFRAGLGLNIREASTALGVEAPWLETVESGAYAFPDAIRAQIWSGYADWAARRFQRIERAAAVHRKQRTRRIGAPELSSHQVAEAQRLAYAPRLSPAAAEREARRLLGLSD